MKIAQLLQEYHYEPKNGEINLGIANGWDQGTIYFMEAIKPFRVEGSRTERNLGRCYNEYSFTINDSIDEYNIVYSVDSGD